MLLVAQASFLKDQHARLRSFAAYMAIVLSLYRYLRRPFSSPSEERVGFPPWCRLAFMTIG